MGMQVTLVGADYEENLGLGAVAAVAEAAGHTCRVVPFNVPENADLVVDQVLSSHPQVVGFSVQFQHRAHEFLSLARALRARGFTGHLTCGGQWPSQAWRETLAPRHGIDSVTMFESEQTLPELLHAIENDGNLTLVPGLAVRTDAGLPHQTKARGLVEDLDAVPFPKRYRPHDLHYGVPFIPIMGSRGCWGSSNDGSITSDHNDAHDHGAGARLRQRSPQNVAAEMAQLWHRAGGTGIFCFHDDNFLLPQPEASRDRIQAIRHELDNLGVGHVGWVAKCRPDGLTPDLAKWLAEQGVLRLYVGVENASGAGALHLGRGTQQDHTNAALAACSSAGIFVCYNLLLFEPDTKLADVAENIAFIREHPGHPIHFCRAEPYYGTPLMQSLQTDRNLSGSYLGYDYRIQDDQAELLFRLTAAIFRDRNFSARGVANRYMGLGYSLKVLDRFYPHDPARLAELELSAERLTRAISLETADLLEQALILVEQYKLHSPDWFEGAAAQLGLRVAHLDGIRHRELDELLSDIRAYTLQGHLPRTAVPPAGRLTKVARTIALGASLALGATGCEDETTVLDPLPSDSGLRDAQVRDAHPPQAGPDAGGQDAIVVDPLPADSGRDAGIENVPVVDPPPADAGVEDVVDNSPVDTLRHTAVQRTTRTMDLPLHGPPTVRLMTRREDGVVRATAQVDAAQVSLRWQARGAVDGDTDTVKWLPADEHDRLVVIVRSAGGLALASVRAKNVA